MVTPLRRADVDSLHQLEALYHLAVELSGLRDIDSVLDVALRHCLDLTDSQFGFIGLGGLGETAMEIAAIHGFHPSAHFFNNHRFIPLRPNIFANAVLENRPVRSGDARIDPVRVGQPDGHPQVKTFLGVPLRLNDEPIGMIGVANRPDFYGDSHERLLLTYAAQVAIVIDNAQLYERLETANELLERTVEERTTQLRATGAELVDKATELQRVLTETVNAQEQERQRIARDIHDGINQLLIAAMLELTSGIRRLEMSTVAEASDAFNAAHDILRQVESEIRRVVHDLHPPILEGLGLAAAIRRMIDEFADQTGISSHAKVENADTRLPANLEVGAYRILQESIHNVASHAEATELFVHLTFTETHLELNVNDNGLGFDADSALANPNGHLGLRSMRHRAQSLDGTLVVTSAPGRGTTVSARLPHASDE